MNKADPGTINGGVQLCQCDGLRRIHGCWAGLILPGAAASIASKPSWRAGIDPALPSTLCVQAELLELPIPTRSVQEGWQELWEEWDHSMGMSSSRADPDLG